ncbi:MAG TPA: FtsX-like permease family protein, partial [Acidimicrobiales bacterium]|nr:FtsX-like permease family protein [Acidimicrobiales bacterium]
AIGPARKVWKVDLSSELSVRGAQIDDVRRTSIAKLGIWLLISCLGIAGCRLSSWNGSLDAWQYYLGIGSFVLTAVSLMLAIGTVAPAAISIVRRTLGSSARGSSVNFRLASANLIRNPTRTGTMAVAIAGAVGIAFIAASFNRSTTQSITGSMNRRASNWVYVSLGKPASITIDSEERFSAALLGKLSNVPGASRVVSQVGVLTGHDSGSLIGVETSDDPNVVGIPIIAGTASPKALIDGQAIVGTGLARNQNLRPGSLLHLDTPTGIVGIRVAGIWENGDFNGSSAFISEGEMQRLYGIQMPTNVYVYPIRGVTSIQLAERIKAARLAPDLHVSTQAQAISAEVASASNQLAPFWELQKAMMVLSFIAILSTLTLAGVQRVKEYAVMSAIGLDSSGLRRLVFTEAGMISIVGSLLGGVLGVVVVYSLVAITPLVIGYHDPFALAPTYFFGYSMLAIVTTLLAAALPAHRAANIPAVEGLREE